MLLGAMIIAGYDARSGGQVWGCPISGTLVREKWAIDGSGSTYLWGYLDSEFRCNPAALTLHLTTCTASLHAERERERLP